MAAVAQKNKDSEIHVTFEDQQHINKFARHNAKLQDLKDELEAKKKEMQNLDDAGDDLLMVDDESAPIPYMVGEVFVCMNMEETNKMLENAKENVQKEIKNIEKLCDDHKHTLSDLKIKLYAKFGTSINLENEEE
ncbi:prefoldin subunit 4-like [Tubulanus polymorphus]|uniref:prefoldin subunit 4-like n=1 Tax=Tubulanus polymorphus TaxID=672921 RepID=UPI003DA5F036